MPDTGSHVFPSGARPEGRRVPPPIALAFPVALPAALPPAADPPVDGFGPFLLADPLDRKDGETEPTLVAELDLLRPLDPPTPEEGADVLDAREVLGERELVIFFWWSSQNQSPVGTATPQNRCSPAPRHPLSRLLPQRWWSWG